MSLPLALAICLVISGICQFGMIRPLQREWTADGSRQSIARMVFIATLHVVRWYAFTAALVFAFVARLA